MYDGATSSWRRRGQLSSLLPHEKKQMTMRPRRRMQMKDPPSLGNDDSYEHVGVIDPTHLCQHPHEACAVRQVVLQQQATVFRLLLLGQSSATPSLQPLPIIVFSFPPLPRVLPIYPRQTIQNMGCPHGVDASSPPQTFCAAWGGGGAVEAEGGH